MPLIKNIEITAQLELPNQSSTVAENDDELILIDASTDELSRITKTNFLQGLNTGITLPSRTKTTSADTDMFLGSDSDGLFLISKADLLKGLSSGGTGGNTGGTGGGSTLTGYNLIMHFDGSNDSTTFTDSSPGNRVITPYGTAKIVTGSPKFGTGSGLFDGSGWLAVDEPGEFYLDTKDFTIECFVRLNTDTNLAIIVGMWQGSGFFSNSSWGLRQESGRFGFAYVNPAAQERYFSGTTYYAAGLWYHIAVTRQSGLFRLFVNGNLEASYQNPESIRFTNIPVTVGAATNGANAGNQRIDELIIKVGESLYNANFTPRTSPLA